MGNSQTLSCTSGEKSSKEKEEKYTKTAPTEKVNGEAAVPNGHDDGKPAADESENAEKIEETVVAQAESTQECAPDTTQPTSNSEETGPKEPVADVAVTTEQEVVVQDDSKPEVTKEAPEAEAVPNQSSNEVKAEETSTEVTETVEEAVTEKAE